VFSVVGAKLPSSQEKLPIYTAETLSIAVTTSCLAALVVGFVSGFLFSRRCRGEEYSNMPYPDQRHQLNRYYEHQELILKLCHEICLLSFINHLTPNGHYMGRTAQLTSRCCILYIYSTNIRTEYFKHAA